MKAFMIKWVLPIVMELLIEGLKGMSSNSSNNIDDQIVNIIRSNKKAIAEEILKRV